MVSERSLDVCSVICFLDEVSDGIFDGFVVFSFVRELKILYTIYERTSTGV